MKSGARTRPPRVVSASAWVALVATPYLLLSSEASWKALYNQGVAALESDDPRTAASLFEKAADLQPDSPTILYGLASAYFRSGRPRQALQKTQKLLALPSADFKLLMATGNLLFSQGHVSQAIEAFKLAQKRAPPTVEGQKSSVYFDGLLAELYAKSKQDREAIDSLERLVNSEPDNPDSYFKLALVLTKRGDFGRSFEVAQQALTKFPQSPNILLVYALVCYFSARNDMAEAAYLRLIRMEPESDQPYFALGNFYTDLGRFRDAAKYFGLAVSKDPKNYLNHYMYGVALFRLDKLPEAATELKKALELDPNHADSCFWLGRIDLRQGKAAEALEAFERTVKVEPKHIGAHYQLGLLYARKGDQEKSKEMFRIQQQLNDDLHKGIVAERMP